MTILVLTACNQATDGTTSNEPTQNPTSQTTTVDPSVAVSESVAPIITADGKIKIDWTKIATHVEPIQPSDYVYPFELDSQAVKNYAQAYQITPAQAQHSMMLAMASPEALGKVLDQLIGHYLGHSLTDGANMSLVIYTSDEVLPDKFDYVFADTFGKGLVLPIVITPLSAQTDKPQVSMMQ